MRVAFVFEFDSDIYHFVRRPKQHVRFISLLDSNNIVNVISKEVDLEELIYDAASSKNKHVTVTDGKSFNLDVHKFSGKL